MVPRIKIKTPRSIHAILFSFLSLAGCSGPDVRLFEADGALLIDYDIDKALEIYEELVREDYAPAKLRLAQVFFNGLSNSFSDAEGSGGYTIEKDYSRAKSLLEELITQGGPNHSALLATILECEAGPYERDYDAIINWKKVAGTNVKTGNALFYADELRTGSFTPQDLNRAEEIYEYYAEYGAWYGIEGLLATLFEDELDSVSALKVYRWASVLKSVRTENFDTELVRQSANLSPEQRAKVERLANERDIKFASNYQETFDLPYLVFESWTPPALGSAEDTFQYLEEESSKNNLLAQLYLAQIYLACPIRGEVDYDDPELQQLLTDLASSNYPPAKFLLAIVTHGGGYTSSQDAATLLVNAAQEGSLSAQELLSLSYNNEPSLMIQPVVVPDPVEGYFWTSVHRNNYLNTLNIALNISGELLDSETKADIEENAKNWKTPADYHGYPVLFDSWPAPLNVIGSLISFIAGLILLYLSSLTLRAGTRNTKNLTVASILFLDALILFLVVLPQGLPANQLIRELFNGAAIAIAPIGILVIASYYIFAGQFVTPLSKILSGARAKNVLIFVGILFAITAPSWLGRIFVFGFAEHLAGLQVNFIFPDTLYLTGFLLSTHIFTLLNLVYFSRQNNRESREGRQASAFLLAYIIRFVFLGIALAIFLTSALFFMDARGIPPHYQTIIIILYALGELLFGVLFSLGILREQIFGIEQLFKRNLVRIVLLGFVTMGFLSAEQLIENFISEDFGTIGGMIVALSMLAVNGPFSALIREQIDFFLPDSNIIDDDASKVYAHQYKLAMQNGDLSYRERDMLRLTAKSLRLTKSQVSAIEQQLTNE